MIYTYRLHKPGEPVGFTYEPVSDETVGVRIRLASGAQLDIKERTGGIELSSPTGEVVIIPNAANSVLVVPTASTGKDAIVARINGG